MPYQAKSKIPGRAHMHGPLAIADDWVTIPDAEMQPMLNCGAYDIREIAPPPPAPEPVVLAVIDEDGNRKPVGRAAKP